MQNTLSGVQEKVRVDLLAVDQMRIEDGKLSLNNFSVILGRLPGFNQY